MTPSTAPQRPNFVANSAQTSLLEGLQPALRSTLSSLNINLDYELARYRYAKRGEAHPGVPPTQFRSRRPPSPNLINVPAATPGTRTGAMPPPPPPNPRLQPIESPPGMVMASTSEVAALRSAIVPQPQGAQGTYMPSSEALLENFDPAAPGPEPAGRTPRRYAKPWLTPLGLGALLLLLVSTAGLGFLLVNPTAASNLFQQTPLAWLFPSDDIDAEATAEGETEGDAATADLAENSEPPLTPLSPDLSQREFADLGLNNLSTVPSGATSLADELATAPTTDDPQTLTEGDRAAAIRREAANTPRQVNQIPTTTTPAPQPVAPVYRAPAPAPAPAAPAPTTQPAPPAQAQTQPAPPSSAAPSVASSPASASPQSAYYVVTDYTGDPSLDDARTVVQDAYVRNFDVGARIQLGAFNTSEGAAALTEELRNQGLEVEVYAP
ncbi:hypothetical protein [Halomicronema sp. CCY15110]|uniref:hypothetical protein n=1 Tax=Halomicronema sp. CCY15110 TaxID=2767773 RepID=UPI001950E250|nr:hypothetical protein [Halomicronema sp. CCY15110]